MKDFVTTRKRKFWIASAVCVFLFAVTVLAATQIYWAETRTTTDDVRSRLENNLAIGASAQDIFAFLDSQGIDHTDIEPGQYSSTLRSAGYGSSQFIGAIFHGAFHTWIYTTNIYVYLVLDKMQHLQTYLVEEINNSL